jgi:hypothetical protein
MTRQKPREKAASSYRRYEQDADHPDATAAHGRDYDGEPIEDWPPSLEPMK